jgi:hypothetical protein
MNPTAAFSSRKRKDHNLHASATVTVTAPAKNLKKFASRRPTRARWRRESTQEETEEEDEDDA